MSQAGVDHWVQRFAREEEHRNGSEPAWLRAARKEALERFRVLGFPTRRDEDWKYTSVAPITRIPFGPTAGESGAPEHPPALHWIEAAPVRLVFVAGRLAPELCCLEGVGDEVRVEDLAIVLARDPTALEKILTRVEDLEGNAFAALNTAFFTGGALVHVRAGAAPPPIALVFLGPQAQEPQATHPRILVRAEAGSRCTLVEAYGSLSSGPHLTNAATEVFVDEAARVELVKLQVESERSYHVSALASRQERDSFLATWTLCFGGALTRNDLVAALCGERAECNLDGLSVLGASQHVDNHTLIDHRAPHGTSHELYKGILIGASRGVFHGKIAVQPRAQCTDARQRNENLLLSGNARVDTKPELGIFADDVRCSHGSTIGHLEDEALFYLRSRGIPEAAARALLTRGFAAAVTERLPLDFLRDGVDQLLNERLSEDLSSRESA